MSEQAFEGNNLVDSPVSDRLRSSVTREDLRRYYAPIDDFGVKVSRKGGRSVVLWSYFDESGKWHDSDCVCMAGYIFDAEHADAFVGQWKPFLQKYNVNVIHMRQLVALKGPYKTWDHAKANAVKQEAVQIIRDNLMLGFSVTVDAKYFRSMPKDRRQKFGGDPQFFCFSRIMRQVVDALSMGKQASGFIFDDAEEYSVKCYHLYRRIRTERPEVKKWISSITFADEEAILPLQAADVLAYLTADDYKQKQSGHKSRPDYLTLAALDKFDRQRYGVEVWDGPEIERVIAARAKT